MLVITAVVYVVMFTSVLGVREVSVVGIKELTAEEVRKVAAVESGTPLARVDTAEVAAKVLELPRVAGVDVGRSLPGTLEITVTERTPVAMIVAEDGFHLVDVEGVDYAVKAKAPAGLPTLKAPEPAAVKAGVQVLHALPAKLRPQVRVVDARTAHDVRLTLKDGRVIKWGGVEDSAHKAAVIGALLTQKGKVYDVAAPEFPTIG
ncbi:cell division protein FtsQ/DivIB [Actinokineospora fastidiosa]|nr:FtsQ-type POTRA domain-containing protein [Actinokineospora fastidiosa]